MHKEKMIVVAINTVQPEQPMPDTASTQQLTEELGE